MVRKEFRGSLGGKSGRWIAPCVSHMGPRGTTPSPRLSVPSDGPQTTPTVDPNEVSTNCSMKSQDLGKQNLSGGSGNT